MKLKILGTATGVRVRFAPSALILMDLRESSFAGKRPKNTNFARESEKYSALIVKQKFVDNKPWRGS
jgi:hypothetical protein